MTSKTSIVFTTVHISYII